MKKLIYLSGMIGLLVCAAFGQSGSVSAAIEPALKAPAQFGFSFAGALNVSPNNSVSLRYGYSDTVKPASTVLAGVGRNLVEFLPGLTLAGDIQAGATFSAGSRRKVLLFGPAVVTDLGNGYTVSYGLHVNKVQDTKLYASVYVSLAKSF